MMQPYTNEKVKLIELNGEKMIKISAEGLSK